MNDVKIYKKGVLVDKIYITKPVTKEEVENIKAFTKYYRDENNELQEKEYRTEDGYQFHFTTKDNIAIIVK